MGRKRAEFVNHGLDLGNELRIEVAAVELHEFRDGFIRRILRKHLTTMRIDLKSECGYDLLEELSNRQVSYEAERFLAEIGRLQVRGPIFPFLQVQNLESETVKSIALVKGR